GQRPDRDGEVLGLRAEADQSAVPPSRRALTRPRSTVSLTLGRPVQGFSYPRPGTSGREQGVCDETRILDSGPPVDGRSTLRAPERGGRGRGAGAPARAALERRRRLLRVRGEGPG